jgi:hypothetical protein
MSDETVSDERLAAQMRDRFATRKGLASYTSFWTLTLTLPPLAVAKQEWWALALAAALAALCILRPSIRLLWKHTEWFPTLTFLVLVNSMAFLAVILMTGNSRLAFYPYLVTGALTLLALPAVTNFCRKYGLRIEGQTSREP